jgi:predicted nucleic acid-binding protein
MPSSWLCVDANLVVRLIADPADTVVRQLWEEWGDARRQVAAPTLLYYEVTNALYRYQQMGLMSESAVRVALEAALALPLDLHGEDNLHQHAVDLARRFLLPAAYDAHYLALAERLGAEFWTADGPLARTVQPAFPWVYLVRPSSTKPDGASG